MNVNFLEGNFSIHVILSPFLVAYEDSESKYYGFCYLQKWNTNRCLANGH